jgi:hypothetical protein
LPSDAFSFRQVSQSEFKPIAKEMFYYVTNKATHERGIRMLFGEVRRHDNEATVSVVYEMSSGWCGTGRDRQISLRRLDGVWRMVGDDWK